MGFMNKIFGNKLVEGYDYDECVDSERVRLKTQSQILRNFDMPILNNILANKLEVSVLDIGCNEGDNSMDRLSGYCISEYIGLDRSKIAVDEAVKKFGDDMTHFYQADVTSPKFSVDLCSILQRHHLEQVDLIIISMVLLHLEDPQELLKVLYPFLKKGGTIFIRDIDDRDNHATPDTNNFFERGYEIVDRCATSGNRHVGRLIGGWLTDAGYNKVQCVRRGLSSEGMTDAEKIALYDTYFGFFMEDALVRVETTHGTEQALADLGWCTAYLPKIKELFLVPGFVFTLGFTTWVATKEV